MSKLAGHDRLRDQVQARVNEYRSPEQIMNRLVVNFPDDEGMCVSHETIYRPVVGSRRAGSLPPLKIDDVPAGTATPS